MRFKQMLRSAKLTAKAPFEVVAWMDEDDRMVEQYPDDPIVRYIQGERPYIDGSLCTSGLWSRAWEFATGDIAMLAADDIMFHTPGWDVAVEQAIADVPDRIVMVYADDGTRRRAPVNPFVHRDWIDAAGFTPPDFQGWFADEWVWSLAAELGRVRFLKTVRIAHFQRHRSDATYRDGEAARDAVGGWQGMRERFFSPPMVARRDIHAAALSERMTSGALPFPDPMPEWLTQALKWSTAAR